jgi:hypothetical protein
MRPGLTRTNLCELEERVPNPWELRRGASMIVSLLRSALELISNLTNLSKRESRQAMRPMRRNGASYGEETLCRDSRCA